MKVVIRLTSACGVENIRIIIIVAVREVVAIGIFVVIVYFVLILRPTGVRRKVILRDLDIVKSILLRCPFNDFKALFPYT